MQFEQVLGLDATKKRLLDAVERNQVAHAMLFVGQAGGGALALARAYATLLNCQNPTSEGACGKCASCIQNRKLAHPDLHFVYPLAKTTQTKHREDALKLWREFLLQHPYPALSAWAEAIGSENKAFNIAVAESRQIIRDLSLKAYMGKYKVLIIWLPEYMNPSASNAILKVLEEPPERTVFLLVTEEPDKLLPTILSRCQPLRIPAFSEGEVSEYLKEAERISPEKASQVATLVNGNIPEAIRIAHEIQDDSHEVFADWMRKCFQHDYTGMTELMEKFQKSGKEAQRNLLLYASTIFREALVWKISGGKLNRLEAGTLAFVEKFSTVITSQNVEPMTKAIDDGLFYLERNANPKILFLNLSIELAERLKPRQKK
ncbi:MAG: DNA polymerase III subunit delta' [Bacteroidota bacterium]